MKVIRNRFLPIGKRYGAINLFGVLFVKRDMAVTDRVLNHEKIHTMQMRELGYLGFYLLYVTEWLWRLIQTRGDAFRAYQRISFEREAYDNDSDLNYLSRRRHYAEWRKR